MTSIIPTDKFREIATEFLGRTKSGQVAWEPDEKYENSYVVRLPKSTIAISQQPVQSAYIVGATPSEFVLGLRDANDLRIGEWGADNNTGPDYQVLADLYREASRVATKWDEVLDDINKAMKSNSPIGKQEPKRPPFRLESFV